MAQKIQSSDEFKTIIGTGQTTLAYLMADWCSPCKIVGPIFDKLSEDYPLINFVKINIDEIKDLYGNPSDTKIPKFILYKNGERYQDITCTSKNELRDFIDLNA
jgi:thioredoxin 1